MSNDQAGTGGTAADDQAQAERIKSWVDAGATSIPALIIALTSALGGTILMVLRRRQKS